MRTSLSVPIANMNGGLSSIRGVVRQKEKEIWWIGSQFSQDRAAAVAAVEGQVAVIQSRSIELTFAAGLAFLSLLQQLLLQLP